MAFAIVLGASAFSGVAIAGDLPVLSEPPQKPSLKPKQPPQEKSASEQAVASLTSLLDRVKKVNKDALASAKKKKRRPKRVELIYSMSVDQGSTYRAVVTIPTNIDDFNDYSEIASRIIKRDLATGAETELYKSRNALAIGVVARSGHVAAQIFRVVPYSKRSVDIQSSILSARSTDTTMRIAQSRSARISAWAESLCGAMHVIAGMSMQGEAVVLEYDSDCKKRTEKTSVAGLSADGTMRPLLAPGNTDLDSGLILAGDLLTTRDEFDEVLDVRNVATGETTRLWSGSFAARDLAEDGTFAVATESDSHYYPDEVVGPPLPGKRPKKPKRKPANVVVFPKGDPETPKLNEFARSTIETLKFCASRLYAVRVKSGRYSDDEFLSGYGLFGSSFGDSAKYEILLLTADGVTEKTLASTKKISPADVTCNGEKLVIGTNNLTKVGVLEVGP